MVEIEWSMVRFRQIRFVLRRVEYTHVKTGYTYSHKELYKRIKQKRLSLKYWWNLANKAHRDKQLATNINNRRPLKIRK